MSAVIDTIIVGGGPAGLSAALLLVRCLNNVVVCDVGHPRNEPSRIFKGYLSATVHASNLAITRLCHCDSQWWPTLCGAKGEFTAILESGECLAARTILIAIRQERAELPLLRRLGSGCQPIAVLGETQDAAELAIELVLCSSDIVLCTNAVPVSYDEDQEGSRDVGSGL